VTIGRDGWGSRSRSSGRGISHEWRVNRPRVNRLSPNVSAAIWARAAAGAIAETDWRRSCIAD
jgi:hypothetical protein